MVTRRLAQLASRGALLGAAAAVLVAVEDFGASWLWIPWWPDRLSLLWRLPAVEIPLGATLGALLFVIAGVCEPWLRRLAGHGEPAGAERRHRRLWPLPFVALATPVLVVVGAKLFTGGKTSRLPARDLLVVLAILVLIAGTYAALRIGRASYERFRDAPRTQAWAVAAVLLASCLGLAKIDQYFYPKLYDYLHAMLGAAAFLTAGLGLAIAAAHMPRLRSSLVARSRTGLGLLVVLWAVLAFDLVTLHDNQNVRVALFDPRAAVSRSVMQAVDPLLRDRTGRDELAAALARARQERASRRTTGVRGLPEWPGAHVLFITVDALRADHLGIYGYTRHLSPHIDALAHNSVVFDHAYTAVPHSSYSLCSIMTSEYLHEVVDINRPLPTVTLPGTLNKAGYLTAGFYTNGIFHTEGYRVQRYHDTAFDFQLHEHSDLRAEPKTDQVLAEVDRIVAQGEPPSFMWVHYFDVHEPYLDRSLGNSAMDRYDAEIRDVDRAIDRLVREARKRLHRDLIVIISADHGEEFRDHGGLYHGSSVYEEQVRVPLIIYAPGLEPRRVEAPVESIDIAPTILGMLGVPIPSAMRGTDLRALMTGKVHDVGPAFAAVMKKRMVVRWPYKLIADLRYNLYELYNLEKDPKERHNLANKKPKLVNDLRGEIYAWLDALQKPPGHEQHLDPRQVAIDRGQLGDRRALKPLAALLRDETAPSAMRCEAARLLGNLGDTSVANELARTMQSPDRRVAAEATIALGRLYDKRAQRGLRQLVYSEDVDLRTRAAVSLGRLRDPMAVPALIEAATAAKSKLDREEAIRWLGRLRDPRAVQPLLAMISELRVRNLAIIALGQIGDPRTYDTLVNILSWEHRPDFRDSVARALGQMGNPAAIPRLVSMSLAEPDLRNVSESLVRLKAPERGFIGGTDVGPKTSGLSGFGKCQAAAKIRDWEYDERTWCATTRPKVAIHLPIPSSVRSAHDAEAVVRARRLDSRNSVEVTVRVAGRVVGTFDVGKRWKEARFDLQHSDVKAASVRATLEVADPKARLGVDHFLIIPGPPSLAAR